MSLKPQITNINTIKSKSRQDAATMTNAMSPNSPQWAKALSQVRKLRSSGKLSRPKTGRMAEMQVRRQIQSTMSNIKNSFKK